MHVSRGTPRSVASDATTSGLPEIAFGTRFVRLVYLAASVLVVAVLTHSFDRTTIGIAFGAVALLLACTGAGVATRRRAQSLLRQLQVQHRVALAGIGGGVDDVSDRVVHELVSVLDLRGAAVLLADEHGVLRVAGSTLLTNVDPGQVISPLPGLTIERAMATGEVQAASTHDLEVLHSLFPEQHGSVVAPLRSSTGIIGVLVCDDGYDGEVDRVLLRELADLVVVALEAARALDREAAVAARYQELDAMRSEFVAVTSHELRTPIGVISGAVETLDERGDDLEPEVRRALVDMTMRQTDRLVRLAQDLQATASADMGTLSVREDDIDLPVLVATSVHDVLRRTGIDVRVELPDGPVHVRGDADRLGQVVSNLVRNALDHGGDRIVVQVVADDDTALVRVSDDGPGVRDDLRASLFDRFARGTEVERHSRGMGLGLAVARELAEAMGGSLDLAPGTVGATFELRLPAVVAAPRTILLPLVDSAR